MDKYILVFDAGTGAGRCAVVNQSGRLIQTAYQEWNYEEDPSFPDTTHFNASSFAATLWKLAKLTIKEANISGKNIRAVTVTSLREGVLFIDWNGVERYAGSNFDDRALEEGASIEEALGEDIYFTSGTNPPVYGYAARVHWFQKNKPDIFETIQKILTFGDWIIWKLSGVFTAEPSLASSSGIFDVKDRTWSHQLCDRLDIQTDWLPSIHTPGEVIGTVRRRIASDIGIKPGTPVVLAGGDTQCAMLGMGLAEPNRTGCVAGTTSPIQMLTSEPTFDPLRHTWTNCSLLPHLWCLESNAIVTGLSLRWLRDSFGLGLTYDQMNALVAKSPIGSKGIFAFIGAEVMDMTRYTGSWTGGFLFQVPPAIIDTQDFLRAVWESIAYAVRGNLDQLTRITGKEIKELDVCGGQSASPVGMQILADVLGIPLTIHHIQSSILGAAACAAYGVGDFASLTEAAEHLAEKRIVLEPNRNNHRFYQEQYPAWLTHYKKIRELQV
jgi:autoinducer 2 (AI-2) kinase